MNRVQPAFSDLPRQLTHSLTYRLPLLVDNSASDLPALPEVGGGYSVIGWADRFLRAYSQRLEHQGESSVASQMRRIQMVLTSLDVESTSERVREEADAFEAASEHFDYLRATGAPEYLVQAFQLVMLLQLCVDQLRKTRTNQSHLVSFADVEEVVYVKRCCH